MSDEENSLELEEQEPVEGEGGEAAEEEAPAQEPAPPAPIEIVQGDLLALPPKASRISIGAAWHSATQEVMDLDLAAIAFAEDGTLLDAAYFHNLSTAHSAIRHMGDDKTGLGPEEQDDEVIHVYPKALPADVKTIVFVVSATSSEQEAYDLTRPSSLQLSVYSSEEVYPTKEDDDGNLVEDREADPIVRNDVVLKKADLKHFLVEGGHSGDQSTSPNQSLIVCALCKLRNSEAWTVQIIGQTQGAASWGMMIPQIKECLKYTPEAKAHLIQINPEEYIAVSRKAEDRALEAMIQETKLAAAVPLAQEPERPERLRFDLGWTYWPPKKQEKKKTVNEDGEEVDEEEEEEPEPPTLEYAFAVYDYKGEKIATVDAGSSEADGIRVLGDDDLEKDLETGTGRDPIGFAVKASVLLEVNALPPEARSIVVLVSQFSEGGFKAISGVHGRLVEVLPPLVDPNAKPKRSEDEEEEEEEEEEAPQKPRFRDLASYHFDSKEGADEEYSTMALCKIYREFKHSAYWAWRETGNTSLADFIQTDVKEVLRDLQAQKKAKDEQEKPKDEEEEDEDAAKSRMKPEDWQWRVRSLGLRFKGPSLEDQDRSVLDVATYEGRRNDLGERHDPQAKAFFANGDTFFGEYAHDQKSGLGIYIFANGGTFVGEYSEGKRHGQGVLLFPDGSCYEGDFVNDKFEGRGQYTYADGSVYIGQWKAGKKDGQGVYWYPGFESCLRGEWKEGYAHGTVRHETSRYEYEGQFDRGVPEGVGKFVISAQDRLVGQRPAAAGYLLHDFGPSLSCEGVYSCPVPTEDDAPPPEEEEEGQETGPRVPNPELRKQNAAFKHKDATSVPVQVKDPVYPEPQTVGDMPDELAAKLGVEQVKTPVLPMLNATAAAQVVDAAAA